MRKIDARGVERGGIQKMRSADEIPQRKGQRVEASEPKGAKA